MSYSVKTLLKVAGSVALVLAVCFALVAGLTGCGDKPTESTVSSTTLASETTTTAVSVEGSELVGKWYSQGAKETLEFTSDGKMVWTPDGGQSLTSTCDVVAGVIVLRLPNAADTNSVPYVVQGNTLTTTDPKYGTLTYTKQ